MVLYTLPNNVTGSRWSTRHSRGVITLRPGALLEIFNISHGSSTPNKNCTLHLLFLTEEDDIARFDSWRYMYMFTDFAHIHIYVLERNKDETIFRCQQLPQPWYAQYGILAPAIKTNLRFLRVLHKDAIVDS